MRVRLPLQGADIDDRPPIHCGLRRERFRRFWQGPWLFQAGEALQGLHHLLTAAHVDHAEGRVEVADAPWRESIGDVKRFAHMTEGGLSPRFFNVTDV